MQFIPSSWAMYGVDANGDGKKDPFNPVDAIFAAARYLRAAGGDKNIGKAIFAYNHADWYVQSVLLRAKLIGGMPADLIGSLTGLTQGHFPVAATATYADDLNDAKATRRVRSGNAAVPVSGDPNRRAINIYSRAGAPVIAVNDGIVRQVGRTAKLGRYVVLEDAYGNRYTYSHLGKVAPSYPAPKAAAQQPTAQQLRSELEMPPRDPAPTDPASAGLQQRTPPSSGGGGKGSGARSASTAPLPAKERLFAHPARGNAYKAGGDQQLLGSGTPVAGYATFDDYVSKVLGLSRSDVQFKALRPGAQVIAGTILGRIDKTDAQLAPHVTFAIKPAGRGAPQIDPKPILDGWKLLEATAIYRASGKNPFWGRDARNPSIGQILLMSKTQLEQRVLNDPRVEIYDCGRRDIQTHIIPLMNYPGIPYAWAQGDHADHIHIGFQPLFGDNTKLRQHYDSILKPDQWVKLIDRLNQIDEPTVPTKPSKYALGAR